MKKLVLLAIFAILSCKPVMADVTAVDLGTANPPATLGGYAMAPFEPGTITGESYTAHEVAGFGSDGWATWGQTYTGAVHVVTPNKPLTVNLSGGVSAVYFYEEPDQFSNFEMTATDSSGKSVTTVINGFHGSSGVGFYENIPADSLTSITVTSTDPDGFAIGEFGLNGGSLSGTTAPEPASLVGLLGIGGMGLIGSIWRRRRAA